MNPELTAFLLGAGVSALPFFMLGYWVCKRDPYQNTKENQQ